MGFIAEFTLSNPILQQTRRAVPEIAFEVEDEQPTRGEQTRLILWARGTEDDLDRFFGQIDTDPSITGYEILSALPERRLFRITLSEARVRGVTYVEAIDLGITFLDIVAAGEGVDYRAHVPDRDALSAFRERCRERGLTFDLRRLYRSEDDGAEQYGLTDRQREVLCRALERGYFDVPRSVSAGDLAAELGISAQALSTLLRRGTETLLRNTIAEDTVT